MSQPDVSLVFPAYNEAEGLERAVSSALEELHGITPHFEIIVAEDGSSDGTDELADRLAVVHPEVRHLHSVERLGRGKALNRAFKYARGAVLVYMDVDLATDITQLRPLVDAVRGGADLATGSRMLPDSRVTRSARRSLASQCYNTLIRTLFGTPVHDHQCGFKAFDRARLMEYIDEVDDNHWFWDTEVLIRGHRGGLKIVEIPVDWVEGKGTKVKLFRDSYRMGSKALGLWWRLRGG
ncbi:TPA: glycosyltransferase family 2 protein [Candidatus Bathyarchaeota archaeon]|nr:glycosyltransferase family 2 protein [Candidatus Bathyarchaeota archaeon]